MGGNKRYFERHRIGLEGRWYLIDYADLREGIYDALCTIPAIQDSSSPSNGKVYWEWCAPADTVKPFLEMAFIGELPSPNKCALHMQLEVLVIGEPSDILSLDPLADLVISTLHHQQIVCPTGRITELCYVRDSRFDLWIEQLSACGIRLKFVIPTDFWI